MLSETRRLHEVEAAVDAYKLWHGQSRDAFAEATVTGTAALALWTIDPTTTIAQAQVTAQDLWANRDAYERLTA